jgi:hypothetical protein
VHTARGQNIKCQHLQIRRPSENPCSALNIVWRTGIGTPSLRPGFPQGKFQGAERADEHAERSDAGILKSMR